MSRIDTAHAAVRAQPPFDIRRETRWQYDRRIAQAVLDALGQESAERCSMCRDGVSHSARCHHDEHEVCDRVAEGTDAPKSCACPCHSPADPVRCPKCGGPHPFHDPACVVHPDLIQDQSGTGAE